MNDWPMKDTVRIPQSIVTARPPMSVPDAWELMLLNQIHHLVVVTDDGKVVGIVSDRDLFEKGATAPGPALDQTKTVADVMCPVSEALTDQSDLQATLRAMRDYGTSALPLVNQGELTGIVTETDLLRAVERFFGKESPEPRAVPTTAEAVAGAATDRSMIFMSNPLVQNLMQLLAEAGI